MYLPPGVVFEGCGDATHNDFLNFLVRALFFPLLTYSISFQFHKSFRRYILASRISNLCDNPLDLSITPYIFRGRVL